MTSAPTIRFQRTSDSKAWDALVDSLTPQPAYHHWAWLDLHTRLNDLVVERLIVFADDRAVGVFPLSRRSPRSPVGITAPFSYLGPLVPEHLLGPTVTSLRAWQRRYALIRARFEMGPSTSVDAGDALVDAGCTVDEGSTLLVDVSHGSLDALRSGYSSLRRRDIRRALRDGSTVRPARPGELALLLPAVLDEAFTAHGKPSPYPASVGHEVERWAADRDDVGLFTALVDDEPAGVQVVLGGGTTAVAWAGACLRRFRDANPNVLLYDALLEWAVLRGCMSVDLGGRVDDGVVKYKAAFGAVERGYLLAESSVAPAALLTAARRVRGLVRR